MPHSNGLFRSDPVPRLLVLVLCLIAYGSLYPGDFQIQGKPLAQAVSQFVHSWPDGKSSIITLDFVLNVLIYIPVGFLGSLSLIRCSPLVRSVGPVLLAASLSASMEILQAFLPTRFTSLLDFASNTLGTLAGVAAAWFVHDWLERLLPVCAARLSAQPGTAMLLAFWIASQWIPLMPYIGLYKLRMRWLYLIHVDWQRFPWELLSAASAWIAAIHLFEEIAPEVARWPLCLPALVLPIRFIILNQQPSAGDVAGAVAAALLAWLLPRERFSRSASIGSFLLIAILVGGLAPLHYVATPKLFGWIPLGASLESSSLIGALNVLLAKAFRYGAVVWVLRQCGVRLLPGSVAVAVLLGAIEWAQRYLPGRTPEITDPLLCLSIAMILGMIEPTLPPAHNDDRPAK